MAEEHIKSVLENADAVKSEPAEEIDLGIDFSELNEEGLEGNMTCEANFTDTDGVFWCNDTYDPFEHKAFNFDEFHSG